MKFKNKVISFLRLERKLFFLTLILILIIGCISWKTFFRTPKKSEIHRAYLVEDISRNTAIQSNRLASYSVHELEFIQRLDLDGLIALEKYPQMVLPLFQELKDYQLFYDTLHEFGPHHVIPLLYYYYDEGNLSLQIEEEISVLVSSVFSQPTEQDSLTPRQKRLLTILGEIQTQKHNFLARFIYTAGGVRRNYVATTTSTLTHFFTGGLTQLNTALVTKGFSGTTTAELVDAGIDILVLIPFAAYFTRTTKTAFRTLKGGRAVTQTGKAAARSGTSTALKTGRWARISRASQGIWRIIPIRTLFRLKYVKWYILGLAVIKPDLINHAATLVAQAVSVPPILMKSGFWFILIFPFLNLLFPVYLFFRFWWRKFTARKSAAIAS